MQIISTIALHNYKVPVIIKKIIFCLRKSRENLINIFQDFPGLTNKIQGLSRTFQESKKNPGLFQDVATLMYSLSAFLIFQLLKMSNHTFGMCKVAFQYELLMCVFKVSHCESDLLQIAHK